MHNLIKRVIQSGNYELKDILNKIETQWIQNSLSDEERAELIKLAQEKANMHNSIDVIKKIEELDRRVKILEEANKADNTNTPEADGEIDGETGDDTENETEPEITYPEFVVGKWYYAGDKISFDGNVYECVAPNGQVCVWNPIDYPPYWQEINK